MRFLVVFFSLCSVVYGQTREMDWKKVDAFQRGFWSSLEVRDLTEVQKLDAKKDFLAKWDKMPMVYYDVVQDVVPQGDKFQVVTSFGSLSIANSRAEAARIRRGDFLVRRGELSMSFRTLNSSAKSIIGLERPDPSMDPSIEEVGKYLQRRKVVLEDFRKKVGDFVYVREVWTRSVIGKDSSVTGTQTEFLIVDIKSPEYSVVRLKDSESHSAFFMERSPEEARKAWEKWRGEMLVEHLKEIEKMEIEKRKKQP